MNIRKIDPFRGLLHHLNNRLKLSDKWEMSNCYNSREGTHLIKFHNKYAGEDFTIEYLLKSDCSLCFHKIVVRGVMNSNRRLKIANSILNDLI